jgi:hypothetical protein
MIILGVALVCCMVGVFILLTQISAWFWLLWLIPVSVFVAAIVYSEQQ